MLDELFHDDANGWMVTPWGADGSEAERQATIACCDEDTLDKASVYACDSDPSNIHDDLRVVTQIGEIIGSVAL